MTARKAAADKTAKKQPRRKGRAAGDSTPNKTPKVAYLVRNGESAAIRKAMEETIPDFADWTEQEKREAVELTHRFWDRGVPDALKVLEGGGLSPAGDPSLAILRISEAFASSSENLCNDRLAQLANYLAATPSGSNDANVSAAFAFVAGGGAQDTVQSGLLTQMAATHDAAMRALRRMESAEFVDQMQTFANISTKLLNLYTRQAETLAKLQRGAEQTVRHVYVDARTQTAYNYPPTSTKGQDSPHEQHEGSAFVPSMLGYDPQRNGMPMSGDEKSEAVQAPRRKGNGSAEG